MIPIPDRERSGSHEMKMNLLESRSSAVRGKQRKNTRSGYPDPDPRSRLESARGVIPIRRVHACSFLGKALAAKESGWHFPRPGERLRHRDAEVVLSELLLRPARAPGRLPAQRREFSRVISRRPHQPSVSSAGGPIWFPLRSWPRSSSRAAGHSPCRSNAWR